MEVQSLSHRAWKESWTGETYLQSWCPVWAWLDTGQSRHPLLKLLFLLPTLSNRDRSPPRGGYRTRDQHTMIKVGPTTPWGTTGTTNVITDKSPHTHNKRKKYENTMSTTLHFCLFLPSLHLFSFIHIFVFCLVPYGIWSEFSIQNVLLIEWGVK